MLQMKKITVIEDDADIQTMLTKFLLAHDYEVHSASNGKEGVLLCKKFSPDLILLDLMLPALSGDGVLKRLREFTDNPVIVLSAKTMVQSKIDLLRLGADDYLTKPFDLFELLARIEANLKRANGNLTAGQKTDLQKAQTHLKYKDLEIKNQSVFMGGSALSFTSKELAILELLMRHPKKIFSKQNLYESIWQEEYACDYDTINTHISNIRKKLKKHTQSDGADDGADYIETIWGIGYRLN